MDASAHDVVVHVTYHSTLTIGNVNMPPTTILHLPASAPSPALANSSSSHPGGPHRKRWLIYFVTGNPGLVGYYDLFLAHLHLLLLAHPTLGSRHAFEIYGRSLSGFESRGSDVGTWPASIQVGAADERSGRKPPFGLQEQIDGVERALWDHVEEMRTREAEDFGDDENGPQILVIGHSVGAYITLEVMRRWRERLKNDVGCKRGVIQGGVCLFPTVTHIAKSSSGVKLTVRRFTRSKLSLLTGDAETAQVPSNPSPCRAHSCACAHLLHPHHYPR